MEKVTKEVFKEALEHRDNALDILGVDRAKMDELTYDDWLEKVRRVPTGALEANVERFRAILPVEGFAAVSRWLEIVENPSKMDKLYRGRLKAQEKDTILDLAVGDDEEAFYEALIVKTTRELEECTGSAQEVARLTMNLKIFRSELHEARSRKPKKGTVLEKVLAMSEEPPKPKKPAKKKTTKKTTKGKK